MEKEAGFQQVTLLPGLIKRVDGFIPLCQNVPVHQYKCKLLAEHMEGLIPFLKGMETSQTTISFKTDEAFKGLMHALIRAEKVVVKLNHTSRFKRMFLYTQLAEDLNKATGDILDWIKLLPFVQFKISSEKEEEIKKLKLSLERLREENQNTAPNKDEHDFKAEFRELVRARDYEEASTSAEGGRVMDDLLIWLARRFDSDVETVQTEWQELKEEAVLLREQIEYTTETKRKVEDEFLRQIMVYIGQSTEHVQTTQVIPSISRERKPPEEFRCPICFQLMKVPTVCASGHSYCKTCITTWFTYNEPGKEKCPVTGIVLPSSTLIENITLRSLIRRWKDSRLGSLEHLNTVDVAVDSVEMPPISPVEVPTFPLEEPVDPGPRNRSPVSPGGPGKRSLSPGGAGSRPLGSSPSSTVSVHKHIDGLLSNKHIEIRSNLKQLELIAQHSSGQREIYSEEGIPAIAKLLDSDDHYIVERAVGVLEAITFEVKGENCEHLDYEERERIWSSVADYTLDSLIKIMHLGSQRTRFKAAQTLINLMADDEIRGELTRREGVVKSFFGLTNIASGGLFPSEGKSLCLKGLALLGGEKSTYRSSPDSDVALKTALIRLASSSIATPKLVEEALVAVSSMVEVVGPGFCGSLLQKNDIKFLIRLYPRSVFVRRGHSSTSRVLTSVSKKEVLNILDDLSFAENLPEVLVDCGLSTFLLPCLTDSETDVEFVTQGIKLLWRCISTTEKFSPVNFQIDFQMEMKGLVNILARDQTPADSKATLLSTLVYLCKGRDVDPLRESFLSTGGVAALEVLAKSPLPAIREEVALMFRHLAQFHPRRKELRTTEGTMLLMNLLADDHPNCRCQAVVAVATMIEPGDWSISNEVMCFPQVVELLHLNYPWEYREAAICVLSKASQELSGTVKSSGWKVLREKRTIHDIVDIFQHNVGSDAKLKAAELLISLAVHDHTICSDLVGEGGGLSLLMGFGNQHGGDFRGKLIQLLNAFCQESDETRNCVMEVGGVSLLVDALEKGRNREEISTASTALTSLVTYWPAKEAAIEAGLVEKAIECISRRICSFPLLQLMGLILDKKTTAERIREATGVQIIVRILTPSVGDKGEKRTAASVLAKLIKLDQEVQPILKEEKGISYLTHFLKAQAGEPSTSTSSSGRMEALEALCAATDNHENLLLLLREQCIDPLLSILSREALSPANEELVLNILWKLSRGAVDSHSTVNFKVQDLAKQLLRVIHTSSNATDTSVETANRIIRNVSLFGPSERAVILNEGEPGEGVVKLFLDRIDRCDAQEPTDVAHTAVIALHYFMVEEKGRMCFIEAGGIPRLVSFLNKKAEGQAKKFALKILVMLIVYWNNPKEICAAIWECKTEFLIALGDILENSPKSESKIQGAILVEHLIVHGPGPDVCRSITETGCLDLLTDMKANPECAVSATKALNALQKYHKETKKPFFLFRTGKRSS